jgi:hypothetical protein
MGGPSHDDKGATEFCSTFVPVPTIASFAGTVAFA